MYRNLNEQLIQIKGEVRKKRKWEKQVEGYRSDLKNLDVTIKNLKRKLGEEQEDVHKIEQFTVTNLLLTVLGTKESKLDKEKQEVAAVQLKLDEALKSREEVEASIKDLNDKLQAVVHVEKEYEAILTAKEQAMQESHSPAAGQLFKMSEIEGDIKALLIELDEAIKAGRAVNRSLDTAIGSLEKAQGWGTFDLLGGGLISDLVKHGHIDDASAAIHQAQSRMRAFQKELADVNEEANVHVDISGMLKFADFFFDGLIADWMVQGRINDSLEQTRRQKSKVASIIKDLETQVVEHKNQLKQLEEERTTLIERT
ncbi:hypothetical protein [Pseudalkalibacillus sp. SCS-8]|uniref:hypothetical protein n=1 Tax=Pseudalkalibacillus nanhaiensis TaxID=3115291 RepID=UPI0032D9EE7D